MNMKDWKLPQGSDYGLEGPEMRFPGFAFLFISRTACDA
jgi:hypothetical protein